MGEQWDACNEAVQARMNLWGPLQEWLQWHWNEAEQVRLMERPEDLDGYLRRPTIGLKLDVMPDMVVAVRPGWKLPRPRLTPTGKLLPEITTLELLREKGGKLLTIRLQENRLPRLSGMVYLGSPKGHWKDHLHEMEQMAHGLLMDPMHVFGQQAERCCCCHKTLEDIESRTRGIGPECLRMFNVFGAKPPDKVEKYRQEYLKSTGFLPGR